MISRGTASNSVTFFSVRNGVFSGVDNKGKVDIISVIQLSVSREESLPPLVAYPFKENTEHKPLKWEKAMLLLEQYGPNTTDQKKDSKWYFLLLRAIVHPFNILLTILATIAGATGDFVTVTFMMAMVVLSTGLRFVQGIVQKLQGVHFFVVLGSWYGENNNNNINHDWGVVPRTQDHEQWFVGF